MPSVVEVGKKVSYLENLQAAQNRGNGLIASSPIIYENKSENKSITVNIFTRREGGIAVEVAYAINNKNGRQSISKTFYEDVKSINDVNPFYYLKKVIELLEN